MKVTKLDKRHNCYRIMKYYVETTLDIWGSDARIEHFKGWRSWCWETFGPGCETKWITITPRDAGDNDECRMESTTRWAWHTEHGEMRLYFKTDIELSAFLLRWS